MHFSNLKLPIYKLKKETLNQEIIQDFNKNAILEAKAHEVGKKAIGFRSITKEILLIYKVQNQLHLCLT